MASILMGPLVTEAAGVIDGVVFSSNLGGKYVRALSTVFNPMTEYQQEVRAILTDVVRRWSDTLTDAQRNAWEELAKVSPTPNRLGEMIYLSGIALYCKINARVLTLVPGSPAYIDDAPNNFVVLPCNKLASVEAIAATPAVKFTTTPQFSTSATTFVVVRMSPIMRPGATRPAPCVVTARLENDEVDVDDKYSPGWPTARFGGPSIGDRFTLEVQRVSSATGGITEVLRKIVTFT